MGVPQDIRSRILHHTGDIKGALVNSTYSTYEFQAEKRRALELWERRVMAIIAGRKVPAERW